MRLDLNLERLLAYDHWANGQSLASIEKLPSPPAKAVELMAHVLGAHLCWITRMTVGRDAPGAEDWDTQQTLATIRVLWRDELPAAWRAFLADKTASNPARTFKFVNFLGDTSGPFRVEDAVLQVLFHSPYHRGQIASLVRAAGGEPPATEVLRAVRAGAI